MADIPTEMIGRASAITNIVNRVSSSFGIAVLTSILTTRQAIHGARLAWGLSAANSALTNTITSAAAALGGGAHGRSMALAYLAGMVGRTSFVNAIDEVFIVTAAFTLIALVPALFLKKPAAGRARGAAMAE
jgi:MFS-type transporter involved in bile tolerance (Atg22 family)